jgi:hypothetical protein
VISHNFKVKFNYGGKQLISKAATINYDGLGFIPMAISDTYTTANNLVTYKQDFGSNTYSEFKITETNSDNLPTKMEEIYFDNGHTMTTQYEYVWQNGNLMSIKQAGNLFTEYEYDDKLNPWAVQLKNPILNPHFFSSDTGCFKKYSKNNVTKEKWQNNHVVQNTYTYNSFDLPSECNTTNSSSPFHFKIRYNYK